MGRSRLCVFLLLGLLAGPGHAADCHVAQQAYAEGDYAAALLEWQALAESDHAHSQLMIGSLHFNGEGVAQDQVEAARWFRQAADNGSADAALQLAQMYADGKGVAQDPAVAQYWRSKAAELGQTDEVECHSSIRRGNSKNK